MTDYEPLDLSTHCNVGSDFFPDPGGLPIGPRTFHGLPFVVGSTEADEHCCAIGFGGGAADGPVRIPVERAARYVIFAHSLLETRMDEGEPIGRTVATYRVRMRRGAEYALPVRERFEVAPVPTDWGQHAFLALPDQKDELASRHAGPWDEAGRRQAEAIQCFTTGFYLWAWAVPDASAGDVIASIALEPSGRRFALGAITLGHLDEHPLRKVAKRPVTIELTQPEDARKPFDLAVDVDRGVATYPHALPADDGDAFLADERRGWGEAQNPASSPAYVEIAARKSATIRVSNHGEHLGDANWGRLQADRRLETPRVRFNLADPGRNWVHVRVLDDQTGRTIPCRVHFRSPEGIPYQPHGHHNQVNRNLGSWHQDVGGDLRLGQIAYAYIDGRCQGWLPRGDVLVDVARGYEYEPLRTRVTIQPGQRELELRLKRWTDMNRQRWFSGDSHVHFLGGQGAHREAQGEDLNVVNLLASQWGHLFTNTEDFIGRPTVSDDGATIVYCSQENRQHILGHLTLWGLTESVAPWCSDGPSEAELGGNLEVTLARWADACRAQGGTVVIPHLPAPNGEPAALIATGRADAIEMLVQRDYCHHEYYRYLNCGYRLPLVGGTDKMTSDVPVGLYRTYAWIDPDEPFNYDTWCAAVRDGRTFLSGGPMIDFTVDGARIGDTLSLAGNGGTVTVNARAESIFPIHTLQVVHNGRVVAQADDAGGARRLELTERVAIDAHGWLAARCGGPGYTPRVHHDGWGRGIFAHTSPVYVAVGGDWWMFDADAARYMLTLIDGSVQYIRHHAAHDEHDHAVTHHHGHDDHVAWLEEPFHEAAAAIHRRMHALGIAH